MALALEYRLVNIID